jgi:EAL domain-containing protein (putative c-di-GMP-specific phosphodiesterase class I)
VKPPLERRRDVRAALFADEIGIEYGVYGDYRLKSAYQPIFTLRDGLLFPVAVEALAQPHRKGAQVPVREFFSALPAADRLYVETMCRMLHLANFRNIGVDGLDLFFNYDPLINDHEGRALAEIRLMAQHLGEFELDAGMLVCEITETAAPDEGVLARLVGEMRRNGLRIAIDDFGAGHSTQERLERLKPDIVKIDGGWFAQLCRHPAATRLFRPLLDLLHAHGARVLVEGIEEPQHLRLALEGGADLVQGFLLARPAPVGTIWREEPLDAESLLDKGKVIPLFGRPPA